MDKKELERKISELTKKAESKRKKREYIVIGAFTIVIFIFVCFIGGIPDNIGTAIGGLLSSLLLSILHFAITQSVFEHLSKEDEADQKVLRILRNQLSDIERKELDEAIERFTQKENKHTGE